MAPPVVRRSLSAEKLVAGVCLAFSAIVLPLVSHNFLVFQVTQGLVYTIAILGLSLLTGISGQFSLGQGAFYAIGAYAAAILMSFFGVHYAAAIPVAGAVTLVFGLLLGLPASRLSGIYLALATLSLAVAVPQVLKLSPLERWTGGVQGLSIDKPLVPFSLPVNEDQWLYYVVLLVTALAYFSARNLIGSRTGRALLALRDNPIAAGSMGVNVALYKMLAFGLSALFTGVAGALGAIIVQFIAPESFTFYLSVALMVGMIVGGVGWLPGAFVGAAFILLVPNVAEHISKGLSGAVYGVILIFLVFLMPTGAKGLVTGLRARLSARAVPTSDTTPQSTRKRPV